MKKIFLISLLCGALFLNSCKDECEAGDGGTLTINATLKHHALVIPSRANYPDTVFVKFNTQDLPGTTVNAFDKIFFGQPGDIVIPLTGLQCGDYYLYAAGFDTTINQRVVGGIPFSTEQETGEINLNIPVTEGH